jgi:hypothetical protein
MKALLPLVPSVCFLFFERKIIITRPPNSANSLSVPVSRAFLSSAHYSFCVLRGEQINPIFSTPSHAKHNAAGRQTNERYSLSWLCFVIN